MAGLQPMATHLMRLLVPAVLLLQSVSSQAQSPVMLTTPARAIVDSVAAAELRFFREWGQVWRLSEDSRSARPQGTVGQRSGISTAPPVPYNVRNDSTRPRNMHLHCHPSNGTQTSASTFAWTVRPNSMIRSEYAGLFSVCPTWTFENTRGDERIIIDAGLESQFRHPVIAARRSLLAMIEAASEAIPSNDFLIGQRIRFLGDLGLRDSVLSVARRCRGSSWWCFSLRGFALARLDRVVDAGLAFDSALAVLTPQERCNWTDFHVLLDSAGRKDYPRLSCELREAANARIWWLADPMFTMPGNERRVEQFARKVEIAFRRSLDRDERYDWRYVAGGDALEEMVMRYGWPSYTWWGGPQNDRSHSGYLKTPSAYGPGGPLHEPYTSFEYSQPRQHTLALWRAVRDPLNATTADWQVNAPDSGGTDDVGAARWWPWEHYAAPYPISELSIGQMAMLRRDSAVVLAIALDVPSSKVNREPGAPLLAKLLVTDGPEQITIVAENNRPVDSRLAMHGMIPARPFLLGLEIPLVQPFHGAARTRLGIKPPATLASMSVGELAISDPVILIAPEGDSAPPTETDAALSLMASSTTIPPSRRLAVHWETYGFKPTDSVDVAVWVERYTSQGLFRRLGNALRVTTDLNTPVATTWREPQPAVRTSFIPGRIPVVARTIVLDASKLPRGSYWLQVAIAKPGETPITSRRSFVIQ